MQKGAARRNDKSLSALIIRHVCWCWHTAISCHINLVEASELCSISGQILSIKAAETEREKEPKKGTETRTEDRVGCTAEVAGSKNMFSCCPETCSKDLSQIN